MILQKYKVCLCSFISVLLTRSRSSLPGVLNLLHTHGKICLNTGKNILQVSVSVAHASEIMCGCARACLCAGRGKKRGKPLKCMWLLDKLSFTIVPNMFAPLTPANGFLLPE